MPRQLAVILLFEPLPTFLILAGGAMAVAAGAKECMHPTAALAGIDDRAAVRCAAMVDGLDYF